MSIYPIVSYCRRKYRIFFDRPISVSIFISISSCRIFIYSLIHSRFGLTGTHRVSVSEVDVGRSSYISWILLGKTEFKTCSLLHKILLNKWSSAASTSSDKGDRSVEQKPERIPRLMTAFSHWRSSAVVSKPRHVLAAWLRTDRSGGCWL